MRKGPPRLLLLAIGSVYLGCGCDWPRTEQAPHIDKGPIPEGYVVQILEPTGGRILKPKGWHYYEMHHGDSWVWTITKEDTSKGDRNYDTGFRIQAWAGVKETGGNTPEAFAWGFFNQKKSEVTELHHTWEKTRQGIFDRIGLEATEGDYRITYSMFWNNAADTAVLTIAGSKAEDWMDYREVFEKMAGFELIDLERFNSADEQEGP